MSIAQEDSKSTYIMKSLLLPGWGNYELKGHKKSTFHLTTELTMWIGYVYYQHRADELKKDYQLFAKRKLNLKGSYSDAYYRRISIYRSYEEYIEFQQRQGRDISKIDFDTNPWQWESDEQQGHYSDLRKEAIETDRLPALFVYGMIFNRVVSVFTTSYDYNQLSSDLSLNSNSVEVSLSYHF
jgi:hypothetical protein